MEGTSFREIVCLPAPGGLAMGFCEGCRMARWLVLPCVGEGCRMAGWLVLPCVGEGCRMARWLCGAHYQGYPFAGDLAT